jgi:sugar phosphate isomerase/epimerase
VGLNLLPRRGPVVGITLDAAGNRSFEERLDWAERLSFAGVELNATGEHFGFHAPTFSNEQKEALRVRLQTFSAIAVQAPHQETFDITLVSPSAAIRRASLTELWAVCRFGKLIGASVVTVRTGMPPVGVGNLRRDAFLSECLTTIDRTGIDQGVAVGFLNRDRFRLLESLDDLQQLDLTVTGIALDVAYALDLGATPSEVAAFAAARVANLVYVRVPLAPDLPGLANALKEGRYDGMVTLAPTADAATTDADLTAARKRWETALNVRKGEKGGK